MCPVMTSVSLPGLGGREERKRPGRCDDLGMAANLGGGQRNRDSVFLLYYTLIPFIVPCCDILLPMAHLHTHPATFNAFIPARGTGLS